LFGIRKNIINAKQINLKIINSVLVFAPLNVVDFILSTPALSALKNSLPPEGKLIVLTSSETLKFALNCSRIDKVLLIKTGNILEIIKTLFYITFKRIDIFINFENNNFLNNIIVFTVNAKIKLAYYKGLESKLFNLIYNLKLHTIDTPQHKIVKYLNLVRFIGANSYDFMPKIKIPEKDKEYALEFLKKHNITASDVIIGIHPTLKDEKKRWTLNKYEQLVKNLIDKYKAKILVFYKQDEKSLFNEFMHIIKNQAIAVDTNDYFKMAAIVRFCNCFICNESDFMHIFSPFTNLVVIWGETDTETNKPAGINHEILKTEDGLANSVPISRVLLHIKRFIG